MAKILLADDDKHLAKVLARALNAEGHETVLVLDGQAALDQAEADAPDLVILDVALPFVTGDQVARRLRERSETSETPILFVSGRDGDRLQPVIDLLEPCAFLPKPLDLDDLLATVRRLVS